MAWVRLLGRVSVLRRAAGRPPSSFSMVVSRERKCVGLKLTCCASSFTYRVPVPGLRSSSFVVVVVVPPFAVGCAGWLVWLGTLAVGDCIGSCYLVENS